jgi:hypothetical protein
MHTKSILLFLTCIPFFLTSCAHSWNENKFKQWDRPEIQETGIEWPEMAILPQFALPADTLDAIFTDSPGLEKSEVLMLTTLQGLVNRSKPRIICLREGRGGRNEWSDKLGYKIRIHPAEHLFGLIGKYKSEISGVVLYDVGKSIHYCNLASTVAGITNSIAMTRAEYEQAQEYGLDLMITEDLTGLEYTKPTEIYRYLYENYWSECTHRTILSLSPNISNDIRDMAVATKAAAVWLDPRVPEEKTVVQLFLSEMEAGKSVILGWWPEERSGIGIGTSYGISTIPSDFYDNSTVYSGGSHIIHHAPVPKMPDLENKIYISLFLSDGDNVQYCEHTMPKLWMNESRGEIPINWTASPGLVDLGPGILNYYYRTATDNDCISSGPSGLGYALIYDAHNNIWTTRGRDKIDAYTELTQQYLEKSGMRVITIWDEVDSSQMVSYAENCRHLYGLTQQDWGRREEIKTSHVINRLAIIPNRPCYVNNVNAIVENWKDTISAYTGTEPVFLSAQGVSWRIGPQDIVDLKNKLEALKPGKIEICRGDHFFALYNEANDLPYNLTLSGHVKISATSSEQDADHISDGSCAPDYQWIASTKGKQSIVFDFQGLYKINRYVIRHAGYSGEMSSLNSRNFRIELSKNGSDWTTVDRQYGNKSDVSDIDIPETEARFARITITDPGKDGIVRIGDIEIYGRKHGK